MTKFIDAYNLVDSLPDNLPAIKYPISEGYFIYSNQLLNLYDNNPITSGLFFAAKRSSRWSGRSQRA